jgi:ABC-2 type transport system ATP-binding protein
VAILKRGELIAAGKVDEILANEDIVEVSAADINKLQAVAAGIKGYNSTVLADNVFKMYFPVGAASLENINRHFFENGVVLTSLQLKKKSLESKFFELTN